MVGFLWVWAWALLGASTAWSHCHLFLPEFHLLDVHQTGYVKNTLIHAGQVRYSEIKVQEKEKANRKLRFANKQSSLSKKKAIQVIRSSFAYVILDGHHDFLADQRRGAKYSPIRVVEDLSHLNRREFWAEMKKRNPSAFKLIDGSEVLSPPHDFNKMQDDPNIYYASIVARKFPENSLDISKSSRAKYPAWIKRGEGIPMIELAIADALNFKGLVYDPRWGKKIPQEFLGRTRQVLLDAQISGLVVVPERIYFKDLEEFLQDTWPDAYDQNSL